MFELEHILTPSMDTSLSTTFACEKSGRKWLRLAVGQRSQASQAGGSAVRFKLKAGRKRFCHPATIVNKEAGNQAGVSYPFLPDCRNPTAASTGVCEVKPVVSPKVRKRL